MYTDARIDSIRCVRLILTNPLLSSPSSSSRAVLFFLGSPAVSPLSLSLSLSLSFGEARRAYARAAGRIYSEKAKLNKEEEKKKKKNDDDDDSKEE